MHNEVGFLITSCGLQMPSCLEFLLCFLPVCNQTDGSEMNPVVPSAEETTEGSFLLSLRRAGQREVWMSRSRNCCAFAGMSSPWVLLTTLRMHLLFALLCTAGLG